jgi:hypothetical protein
MLVNKLNEIIFEDSIEAGEFTAGINPDSHVPYNSN